MVCRGRSFGISGAWFSLIVYLESWDRRNSRVPYGNSKTAIGSEKKVRGRRRDARLAFSPHLL